MSSPPRAMSSRPKHRTIVTREASSVRYLRSTSALGFGKPREVAPPGRGRNPKMTGERRCRTDDLHPVFLEVTNGESQSALDRDPLLGACVGCTRDVHGRLWAGGSVRFGIRMGGEPERTVSLGLLHTIGGVRMSRTRR